MTKIQAVTPSFWTGTIENWDTSVWTLEQGKLPTLFGEDGEPGLSLTGLPTDDLTITPDSTTLTRSASPQPVDFSVTGMEDWTHPLIEWSATAGGSIESTVNGEATLTVDANYAGVITVTAENKNSGRTAIATVTVITVPGAPTNVTATPGNGQVTLSWSAPDDTGGAAVIRYEVAGNLVVWASVPSSETSYTFTGLTNGTEYTFKIRAVNVVGNGLEATVTATPGASATVPVTGVTLDLYTLTLLAQGDTQALTATVLPANATNQAVTWRSSDTAVATVDASGTVAGIAEGTATVTATTVDGGFTADCAVTVLPEDAVIVPVTGVSVHPASVSIKPGNTRQITATVSPADATIRDISWRSSDLTVATVDGYGKVTAVALGRATITATTRDGGFTATCAVTVTYETGGYTTGGSSGDSSRSGIDYAVQQGVYWIEQAEAKTLAGSAREKVESLVRTRRSASTGIRKAALEALAGLKYEHDTVADSAVQVRVRIDEPEKLAKDTLVSGYAKGDDVDGIRSIFEKWFENKVRVIHLDQQEDWGAPVKLAAKVDLTGMDTKNLYLYAYDKKTNTYRRIEKPAYWIDQNGYLRFTTEYAGDIIICEGPLERK